jgi:hypothetical protein
MENHITYKNYIVSENSTKIVSIPWSYIITGLAFLVIGILDFKFLGYHIGHPGEDGIGTHIGQGTAVFLGGISFAWTIGLAPLIVGGIMILYSFYAMKQVIISPDDRSFIIQERRLLFPFLTEIDRSSIKKTKYTNTGLKLGHIWIILFIPMGIRVLQFGVPLFDEPLAHDNILPTMMLITGLIDIAGCLLTLVMPTHTLTFQSETKSYAINFLPVNIQGQKLYEALEFNQEDRSGHQKFNPIFFYKLSGAIGMIVFSIIGLSFEFLWGTDLSMVGITYGIYLLLEIMQKDSNLLGYFTYEKYETSLVETKLRKLRLIDILGIDLLFYLSTLEFIWGWAYLTFPNALVITEMILTTIIWIGVVIWIFVYLTVPFSKLKELMKSVKASKILRNQLIFRAIIILVGLILIIIKLI